MRRGAAAAAAAAAAALLLTTPATGAPLSFGVDEFLHWQPGDDRSQVSHVPLARRFVTAPLATAAAVDPSVRVLYAPDGMDRLGAGPMVRFNGYVFTHWPQIDVLAWFAGTADRTVNLPSRGWVEAAHRNGVQVIGTVFFAPVAWGGSPATLKSFLRRDREGRFPAARQLIAIAARHGFDGWFVNAETGLPRGSADAVTMVDFMAELRRIAPPGMTIHWYDALLPDGRVAWQNALTPANARFLQDGRRRTADAMFLNYDWTRRGLIDGAALAERLGRGRYELFVGADLWPQRDAQPAFRDTAWLDALRERPGGRALGSIALFAPNFGYDFPGDARTPRFSGFDRDDRDAARFYDAERRLFAGDSRNLAETGRPGWPGIASLAPTHGIAVILPFRTHFNTGHGRIDARRGAKTGGPWTDLARQDVLPTWQFAATGARRLAIDYDFAAPFDGGSSLRIAPLSPGGGTSVPLYALRLPDHAAITVTVIAQSRRRGYAVRIAGSDGAGASQALRSGTGWRTTRWCVRPRDPDIRLSIRVDRAATDAINLGGLSIEPGCRR